jgi:hypothetical protein
MIHDRGGDADRDANETEHMHAVVENLRFEVLHRHHAINKDSCTIHDEQQ